MLIDLTDRELKVEDFAIRLVGVWLVFGWCLVHKKGVPYSRTERLKQSSNLNLTMKP